LSNIDKKEVEGSAVINAPADTVGVYAVIETEDNEGLAILLDENACCGVGDVMETEAKEGKAITTPAPLNIAVAVNTIIEVSTRDGVAVLLAV
jgi:hypothetical protein